VELSKADAALKRQLDESRDQERWAPKLGYYEQDPSSYMRVREPLASNPTSPCLASSSIQSIWPRQMDTINGPSQLRNLESPADAAFTTVQCSHAGIPV
jgi:hypothetical protein